MQHPAVQTTKSSVILIFFLRQIFALEKSNTQNILVTCYTIPNKQISPKYVQIIIQIYFQALSLKRDELQHQQNNFWIIEKSYNISIEAQPTKTLTLTALTLI